MLRFCLSLPLVLAILLAACRGTGQDGSSPRPLGRPAGDLLVGIEERPKTLDPSYAGGAAGQRIARHLLFESLVQHDDDLELVPCLAESWETPDDTSWIFYLREGVEFHDGEPLTAEDVKYTFEHLLDPATGSPFAAGLTAIERVEVLAPYTVEFQLEEPYAGFLTAIFVSILPRHVLERGDFADTLIGSGPFRFVSSSPTEVVLAPNERYRGGAPGFDRLLFKVVSDESTRFLKLRKGELDLVINALSEHQLGELEKPPLSDFYRVIEEPGVTYNYMAFNLADPALRSPELRRAIAHAIDVDEIIAHRLHGHAERSTGLFSRASPFYEGEVPTYGHDPETARRLLDRAGLPDPDGDGPEPRMTLELKTRRTSARSATPAFSRPSSERSASVSSSNPMSGRLSTATS